MIIIIIIIILIGSERRVKLSALFHHRTLIHFLTGGLMNQLFANVKIMSSVIASRRLMCVCVCVCARVCVCVCHSTFRWVKDSTELHKVFLGTAVTGCPGGWLINP